MIAIVDSGGANLASVIFAIERLGVPYEFTADPDAIIKAPRVILPGVGAAAAAMNTLQQNELVECLRSLAQPVLGICLGMQLLFDWSPEGDVEMLGLISARLDKFDDASMSVPHMGWNTVDVKRENPILKDLPSEPYFYFVHSYYVPEGDYAMGVTHYGSGFASVVNQDNVFGCQFHPERSGQNGAQLLRNFTEL